MTILKPIRAAAGGLILLAACGVAAPANAQAAANVAASEWTIGPIINGRNHSRGMPLQPTPGRNGAWHIDLPQAPGSVHYVTFRHGSLAGKSRIVMRYRIEAAPGVRISPRGYPQWEALLTPYFQRRGDNWSAAGRFETYRWYGTFASKPMQRGEHVIVAPLTANWTALERSTAHGNSAAFRDALAHADEVGFVLGGGDGYGHGAFASGRARLVVTEFRVE
ncbi:MAG: hypothetical protein ACK4K7_07865 [Allosphingosinicella sp.]|uniref:hypothetical protein n=1 Tax=Allosphingosinicella sp. TaxID=2823234 RepID=UPI00392633EE